MPRYFYHCSDCVTPDREGAELPDLAAARIEAARLAGEVVRERPELAWGESAFRVEVTNDAGAVLCTITVAGTEGPASEGRAPVAAG